MIQFNLSPVATISNKGADDILILTIKYNSQIQRVTYSTIATVVRKRVILALRAASGRTST